MATNQHAELRSSSEIESAVVSQGLMVQSVLPSEPQQQQALPGCVSLQSPLACKALTLQLSAWCMHAVTQ